MIRHESLKVTRERNFSPHHMLLGAAYMALEDAENKKPGWFYSELIAMTLSGLAVEAICNAVGDRVVSNWKDFEYVNPIAKLRVICVELDLSFDESEEHGRTPGFGRFRGVIGRFPEQDPAGEPLRVPHIGWNQVRFSGDHPMLEGLPEQDCFYFVHSYRAVPEDPEVVVGTTEYGSPFAAAVAGPGVFAVQFHPEKSQGAGKRLLDSYARWVACS